MKYNEKKYKETENLEKRHRHLTHEYRKLKNEVDDMIDMLEVEDFLKNGPGGKDPE